jgi:hypothetical protein
MTIVSCFLMGGLGNQLFQIFNTIAYSLRYNLNFILPYDKVLVTGRDRYTYWDSLLSYLKKYTTYNSYLTNEDLLKLEMYKEREHQYHEIPEILNKKILFYGYFQSYKYFEDQYDNIISLIKIKEKKEEVSKEFPKYFSDNSTFISMHFRLGDYKLKPEYHPIIPKEYYYNSLSYIMTFLDMKKKNIILYFCEEEDNDIVMPIINNLTKSFPFFSFVKVDDNIEDWKQMLIMSNCHHNIIANSTFSWWGAYFNTNKYKIVCYPSIWFGKMINSDVKDMFPENWVKID